MPKRIALFLLGTFLAIGAFLLYQYVGGPDISNSKKPKYTLSSAPATRPAIYESRDKDMQLEYVISASESPLPVLDEHKNPIPGQFLLKEPVAIFYSKDGRIIHVRADMCQATIEQGAKGAANLSDLVGSAGGTATGQAAKRFSLHWGFLRGHVRMTVSPLPNAASNDLSAAGIHAYIADDLVLDGIQGTLTTAGPVQIRSDAVDFDGQGLQLAYNRDAKRIEYLRFDKGNYVVVRGVGTRPMSTTAPGSAKKPAKPASQTIAAQSAKTKPASTRPRNEVLAPGVYRMSFGQNVKAAVTLKQSESKPSENTPAPSSLASERLYVTFTTAREQTEEAEPGATSPASRRSTEKPEPGTTPPATLQLTEKAEPIAPPKPADLVVSWEGSMEMRPSDEQLADVNDFHLEAVGTAANPVDIKDPRFSAKAGRLLYNNADKKTILQPEAFKKVIIANGKDTLTGAKEDDIDCGPVTIDQANHHAALAGPGTLRHRDTKGQTTVITWKTLMDLELEGGESNNNEWSNLAIRRAVMDGVTIKSDTFDFKSDQFDALIANVLEAGHRTAALDHLLATGNVTVHTTRKDAAPGEEGGLQTQRMEIFTAVPVGSTVPAPSKLLADGNVTAWQVTDKTKSTGNAPHTASLQRETITTPKLVADLIPKPAATAPATARVAVESSTFAAAEQKFDVEHFQAFNGASVEVLLAPKGGKPGEKITATADSIESFPLKKTATLRAAKADAPVTLAMGKDIIQGPKVDLDMNSESPKIHIAGAGEFSFVPPPDKTELVPMLVTWQDAMDYDRAVLQAIFTGKPVARMLDDARRKGNVSDGSLSCDKRIVVQFLPPPATATAATKSKDDDPFGATPQLESILAEGNVNAYGSEFTPKNELLRRLSVSAVDSADKLGQLRFTQADNAFSVNGPGALVVEDHNPDPKSKTAGESDFAWKGSLTYDNSNKEGHVVINKDVDFFFMPTKPLDLSTDLLAATPAPAAKSKNPSMIHVHTDKIAATFVEDDSANVPTKSPIGLGDQGKQKLSRVDATGTVEIRTGTYRMVDGAKVFDVRYRITGTSLSFTPPPPTPQNPHPEPQLFTINGTADDPVLVIDLESNDRYTASSVDIDLSEDQKAIHLRNPRKR